MQTELTEQQRDTPIVADLSNLTLSYFKPNINELKEPK